jgi:hypothetical protein
MTDRHREQPAEDVSLYQLGLSCFAFDALTHYNSALVELQEKVGLPLDLADSKNHDALLTWLNSWGTRMSRDVFNRVDLQAWHRHYEKHLPLAERCLWQLTDDDIGAAERAYDGLRRFPGWGRGTAASKVLFAVRHEAFPPWDHATRQALRWTLNDRTTAAPYGAYGKFLDLSREEAQAIQSQCERAGFDIHDLAALLNQREATVASLMNQYMWVRYAGKRRRVFPSINDLRQWVMWSDGA